MNFEHGSQQPKEETEKKSLVPELSSEKREGLSIDILDITPEQLASLKDRIQETEGHVQIIMHPFYGRHRSKELDPVRLGVQSEEATKSKQQEFTEEGFFRIAKHVSDNPKSSPLIVFEEEEYLVDSKRYLSDTIGVSEEEFTAKGLIFVPTLYNSGIISYEEGIPAYDKAHDTHVFDTYQRLDALEQHINANARLEVLKITANAKTREEYEALQSSFMNQVKPILEKIEGSKKTFRRISDTVLYHLIQELGVRSVNLSGGYFKKGKDERGNEYSVMPDGCAGYLRGRLRVYDVLVNLSKYTLPSRDAIEKLDPVTKDTRDML